MADDNISDLKGDVRVLASQLEQGQRETTRRLDNIERKIDDQINVPVSSFEEYKKEVRSVYTTKEEFDPIKRFVYGLVGIVGSAIILALMGIILVAKK